MPPADPPSGRPRRLFTAAEANALLPELVPVLLDLRRAKAALDEARALLAALTPEGNGHAAAALALEGRIARLANEIAAGVGTLAAAGVEVRDLDTGLIDFPARRDDRIVFLCWQLGEGPIAWWHEVDEGFAGRRPLDE